MLKHTAFQALPKFARHMLIDALIEKRRTRLRRGVPTDPHFMQRNRVASQLDYWSNPDQSNAPATYAESPIRWDIDWLKAQLTALGARTVLDFGCNAGRVLHVMAEAGFECIGVELNPDAVALGRLTFPSLTDVTFHTGPDALSRVNQPVDVIYSCAVLRHIAPPVFAGVVCEFGRIAPKYLITIEDEAGCDGMNFPHDYPAAFSGIGYRLLRADYGVDLQPHMDLGGVGVMLRVYEKG